MKYANKSHGNKIRDAYAMFNKVCSLFSEHLVPTPHLKISPVPIFTLCLQNYKCVAHFTKHFLLKIASKGRSKEKFQVPPPPLHTREVLKLRANSTKVSFNLFRVQWMSFTVTRYSDIYIFLLTGIAKRAKCEMSVWTFQNVSKTRFWRSSDLSSAKRSQFYETFRKLQTLKIWNLWSILQNSDFRNRDVDNAT